MTTPTTADANLTSTTPTLPPDALHFRAPAGIVTGASKIRQTPQGLQTFAAHGAFNIRQKNAPQGALRESHV